MSEIRITHISGQRIFILTHEHVCLAMGRCLCKDNKPATLHLQHGKSVTTYSAVLNLPKIKTAFKKRQIAIDAVKKRVEAAPKTGRKPSTKGEGSSKKK